MKKRVLFALVFIISVIYPVFSQQVDVRIRYFDKKIYYTDSPVKIKIEIINNSPDTFRFKLSDLKCYNFQFEVKTLTNRKLKYSKEFIMDRGTNQQVFFREMSLEPGEIYSIITNLTDFSAIEEGGVYILHLNFYPELYKNDNSQTMISNNLTLNIRPASSTSKIQDLIDYETGEIIKANPIPPDEVVEYILVARQKSQWNKFLLYIDLEKLFLRSPINAERYRRLSEKARLIEIEDYKNQLLSQVVDTDIVLLPQSFEILKTSYTEHNAEVKVRESFQHSGFIEIKEYTYYLERDDNIWYITNYEVRNIKTE